MNDNFEYFDFLYSSTTEKAFPYLVSLVQRAVSPDFISRFADIKTGPFCNQLPIANGKFQHNLPFILE